MDKESEVRKVVVVDFDMPFGAMVAFIVKWTLAAIPAMLLLALLFGGLAITALGVGKLVLPPANTSHHVHHGSGDVPEASNDARNAAKRRCVLQARSLQETELCYARIDACDRAHSDRQTRIDCLHAASPQP